MSLVRKMMRHGSVVVSRGVSTPRVRDLAPKKGTAYRRYTKRADGVSFHATKGRTQYD